MALMLGIETSCDDVSVGIFDTSAERILSNKLFSQIDLHKQFGGVVPEIASRSHLEKIDIVTQDSLDQASITLDAVDAIAVTNRPGLVGSLLIGICFAKGLALAKNKKLIGINHLEGHIFSSFISPDGSVEKTITFPYLCLSVSGGHTSFYLVHDFGKYELLGNTIDDAAGEAFDKISRHMGLGYPGGPIIERLAAEAEFKDFFEYTRTKNKTTSLDFTFSGLKTAVLYDMVDRGLYNLTTGINKETLTIDEQKKVASSLLVCITDIFEAKLKLAFKLYPQVTGFTLVGGVACNKYIKNRLRNYCHSRKKFFVAPSPQFCTDNGAMIAFVGGYKYQAQQFSPLTLDVFDE